MANFRHSLIVDLNGNLSRRAREFERDLGRFSGGGRRAFGALRRSAALADRGLTVIGNRYTALATGAGAVGAARFVGGLERRFTRLGIQGNRSAAEMERLKGEIFDVANAPDVRIDPSQLIAGVEQIIEKTGDLDLARENLRNIALVVQAAGASGADAGAMIADLQEKFGLKDKDEFLKTLDTLVRQGKAGAFTLQNMATQGNRVAAAYGSTGRAGAGAAREMGAVLQMIRRGTGSAEQATTAFDALLKTLNNKDAQKLLRREGIQVFDPENPKVMRSVAALMKEIVTAAGGDGMLIRRIFSEEEAFRAFRGAIIEFNRTGAIESLDRFMQIQGDGKQLSEDSARAARDAAAAWQYLVSSAQRFADLNLAGPVSSFADAINSIDPERLREAMELLGDIAMIVGGGLLAQRIVRIGQAMRRALPTAAMRAGAAGGVLGGGLVAAQSLAGGGTLRRGALEGGGTAAGAIIGGVLAAPLGPLGIAAGATLGAEIGRTAGGIIADHLSDGGRTSLSRAVAAADEMDRAGGMRVDVDINLGGAVPSGTEVSARSSRPDGRLRVNRVDLGPSMQPVGN